MINSDRYGGSPPEEPDPYQMFINAERGAMFSPCCMVTCTSGTATPFTRSGHFRLSPRRISRDEAIQQPSRLLAAERQVVPFTGRDHELAALASWRDDLVPGVSVMLVHGPGGQGKTRLAERFAGDCLRAGWTVWTGHHLSNPVPEQVIAPGDPGRDLVLIICRLR